MKSRGISYTFFQTNRTKGIEKNTWWIISFSMKIFTILYAVVLIYNSFIIIAIISQFLCRKSFQIHFFLLLMIESDLFESTPAHGSFYYKLISSNVN